MMFYSWTFLVIACALPVLGQEYSQAQSDLSRMVRGKVNNFKLRLHQKLEEVTNLRMSLMAGKKLVPSISSRQVEIESTGTMTEGCVAKVADSEVVFAVTSENVLSILLNFTFVPISNFPSYRDLLSLLAFEYGREVWMIAQHTSQTMRHFIKMYGFDSSMIHLGQSINLPGPSFVSFTKFGYKVYIAIASINVLIPKFSLYQWIGTQLNEVFSIPMGTNCSAMVIWNIEEDVFVALGFAVNGRLLIKRFIDQSEEMINVQLLDVDANVIKHIESAGSHYLICGARDSVIIYWWTGSVFLPKQKKLFEKTVTDIAVHIIFERPVIAVIFSDKVEFLVQDSSALFINAGNQSFGPNESVKSVLLWKSRSFLYMLPLFKERHPASVYEITLKFEVSDRDRKHSIKDCLISLQNRVIERNAKIEEISSIVENASSSNSFKTSSPKGKSLVKSLTNSTVRPLYQNSTDLSPMMLKVMADGLLNTTHVLQTELTMSLQKSGKQFIESDFHFTNLTVNNGIINELSSHVNLNKVPTSRLLYALKKEGEQTFPHHTMVVSASCRTLSTSYLNGNRIEDYVLLKSDPLILTGDFVFGNVTSTDILVKSNAVNGVKIKRIVLASSKQDIPGLKSFNNLSAKAIQTNKNNHLDKMKGIAYLNSKNFIPNLNFTSTLVINGNLNISLLNDHDTSLLYTSSVKKDEIQEIRGSKEFKSAVIKGNMKILGGINDFTLGNLLIVNTDQIINADVTFSNTTFENVLTDSLNNLDLSYQAVVRSTDNVIKGRKIYRQTLNVSSIGMKEGTLIDSFDPSVEISKIMFKGYSADKTSVINAHWFHSITIGGINATNVQVNESHFPLLEELKNIWLKTTEQNITRLEAKNITVNRLKVLNVNGIAVEDWVTVNGNISINASKNFTNDVRTHSLNLREGVYVNYSSEFLNPDVKIKILDNITIDDAVLEGNLSITGTFKDFESGFMHAERLQTVKDEIKFETIELNEWNSKDLNFELLNIKNFTEYHDRSVLLSKDMRILNKTFRILKGTTMQCNGTLNDVSIDRVVTTNTKQEIASPLKFLRSISAGAIIVKNFFDSIHLEDVIFMDEKRKISNKHFNGNVMTSLLSTSGNINGVNITHLKSKAFNKSVDNDVQGKITFYSNLTANEIQVLGKKRLDNVDLESLIKLNESIKFESLNAVSIAVENVTVVGRINRCPWMSVLQNTLSLKEDAQNITGRVHVNSLKIKGNLNLKYLNGATIPDWILILNISAESDVKTNVVFEKLKIDSVKFLKTVNDIRLDFLMKDCVKKNFPQIIKGSKNFQNITVENVTIDALNCNKMCGVLISEIFKRSNERKTFFLTNLTFASLEINRATIAGNLNGLKFPNGVILTNTTEVIEDEVSINSVNASVGINVFGYINEVHLENFLKERITLNDSEVISSQLIFSDDTFVVGNCTINGTVNKIRVQEIVNVLTYQTVYGRKNFTEAFHVMSYLKVNGSINELFLDQLQRKLLWSSRNESVKDVVKFSELNISSLMCGAINGFDFIDFDNSTHLLVHYINEKLDYFTSDIHLHQDLLRMQRDAVEHPLSLYSSFELHETLNFGVIQRFLPVYEYGTYGPKYELQVTQMIIWIEKGDVCKRTNSLIAEVMSNGTLSVTSRLKGKIFPFSLRVEKENIVGFYVQAEHSRRCSIGRKTRIVIMTLYSTGDTAKKTIASPANATLLDVKLLELHEIFLIISYTTEDPSERIFVYQYDTINNSWSSHQKFYLQDLTSLDVTTVEMNAASLYEPPSVYLSVTGDRENPGVTIYEWDFSVDEFFFKTNISTSVSSHALWVSSPHTLYLLLAKEMSGIWKERTKVNIFTEPLEVYSLEEELILNHKVNVKGVRSLEGFSLADEMFVLASSNHMEILYVLQFRGYNGFEVLQEIPAPGITEARVFTVDSHMYLALNSRTGQSRILKASIRGGRLGLD